MALQATGLSVAQTADRLGVDAQRLTLPVGEALWRLHRTHGEHVRAWNVMRRHGPVASGRFDPHEPPPREQTAGVLYAAGSTQTCVAEVFHTTRMLNRWRGVPLVRSFTHRRPRAARPAWPVADTGRGEPGDRLGAARRRPQLSHPALADGLAAAAHTHVYRLL